MPPPEYAYRLTNASYLHFVILTDNILAAAVAVSSTMASSGDPENFVFHIVTDKKTYTAMHAWFALSPVFPAVVEVKGLHQFDWPSSISTTVMETVEEIHRGSMAHRSYTGDDEDYRRLEVLSPSSFSLLNYLRIHLPEVKHSFYLELSSMTSGWANWHYILILHCYFCELVMGPTFSKFCWITFNIFSILKDYLSILYLIFFF